MGMLLARKPRELRGRGFNPDQGRILGQKNRTSRIDFSLWRMRRGVQIFKFHRKSPRIARDIASARFKWVLKGPGCEAVGSIPSGGGKKKSNFGSKKSNFQNRFLLMQNAMGSSEQQISSKISSNSSRYSLRKVLKGHFKPFVGPIKETRPDHG